MGPKVQKQFLSLQQKIKVLEVREQEKLSVRQLAVRFKIGKTQVAEIIKNRENLMKKWYSNTNVDEKRSFLKSQSLKIDKLCYKWFVESRNKGIPLTGPLVQAKAKEISETLGNKNFSASTGWLNRFRTRHNIAFKTISGESASVNPENVKTFLEKLPSLIEKYPPRNIYNVDETGLFFRALPNKTLALKKERCFGGKLSKDRITILHCANMNGEKEPLLIIGKAARPRAFKNIDLNKLPVMWKFNKKAWMTVDIMTEWLRDFDRQMGAQKRQILLFLDNACSHPKEINLKNIKLCFLPPNCTSVCQPLDQGIIKNFKFNYRTLLLKHLLVNIDDANSAQDLVKIITLLDAIFYANKAWSEVTSVTIKNCFKNAFHIENPKLEEQYDPEEELPLSLLAEIYKKKVPLGITQQSFEEFFIMDQNLFVEEMQEEFVSDSILKNMDVEKSESDESDDDQESAAEIKCSINTYNEAIKSVKALRVFSLHQGDTKALKMLSNLEIHYQEAFLKRKIRQTTLDEFLS
ncbi:tigger transposable element-derived protein 4-like [Euwallacea fornicatus]|uniref:tigger transposable element-derived protein 4-like n=1 Tax=Euwallacea fornicatus TaxID=995702 RepID=UPI00338DCEA4